jgi:hypothetical protein
VTRRSHDVAAATEAEKAERPKAQSWTSVVRI